MFPFDLFFVPNPDLAALWPDEKQVDADGREIDFLEQLQQIEPGSVLFKIMARDFPEGDRNFPQGSQVQQIGNIRTTSELTTSFFGDTRLFFQHIALKKDFDAQPRFNRHYERNFELWGDRTIPEWPEDPDT